MWTAGVAAGPIENGRNGAGCTAIGMGMENAQENGHPTGLNFT